MATVVNFHGRNCIEPGSYAATVYNPTSTLNNAEFGNVMIIDTGLGYREDGYEFSGGSGVHGELAQGLKSVYEFENYQDFLSFVGGGMIGDIAKRIFTPLTGSAGAPKLYYARAATTTCATMTLQVSSGNGIKFTCKNEGVCGNGKVVDDVLKAGFGAAFTAGDEEDYYHLVVYQGNYMGTDDDGEPYGDYSEDDATPEIIAESDDIQTLQEAYEWAAANRYILANFVVTMEGDGTTALTEVSTVYASGGTTEYLKDTEYDDILEAIDELDVTFFLCTNLTAADGTDAATNGKLFTFLQEDAKFREFMVVPGGEDDSDLFGESNCSQAIAKYFNSSQVVVVHGAPIVDRNDGNGTKQLPTIYLAADIIGLNAGMAAQTPITFKRVVYQSFAYDLKKRERERALQAGIIHMRNVSGYWCVNQGVTTLQDNKKTIANDGQSFELSIELIKAQLNKELILEGQTRFTGMTAAQASPEAVKNFTETKLDSLVASVGNDNLLISWANVNVSADNGDYTITYDFTPNVPVNKTFFVGNILDYSF